MSVDRTLHIKSGVNMARNVLKRAERIAMMTENDDFDEENSSPLGLRKTRVKTARKFSKAKAEPEATEEAAAESSEE